MESIKDISTISTISQQNDEKIEKNAVGPDDYKDKLSVIAEAISETQAESNSRSKELTKLFADLGIDVKKLPDDIQEKLTKVAAILRTEGLSTINEVTLNIHMQRKKRLAKKAIRDERELKETYHDMCKKFENARKFKNELEESVESIKKILENANNNRQEQRAKRIVLAVKENDYKTTLENMEANLESLGTTDCYPQDILHKYNEYLELMEEINTVDQELKKYGGLPASLPEARKALEEKEFHLKQLKASILENMKK